MFVCLLVAAPAMLIDLGRADAVVANEIVALATTVHTFDRLLELRQSTDTHVPNSLIPDPVNIRQGNKKLQDLATSSLLQGLTPYLNGQPRVYQPPGTVWLQLMSFAFLGGDHTEVSARILQGRLVSFVMAMVTLAAVYWAGWSIGRLPTAAFASLVCAANPLFICEGRLADGRMLETAMVTLSIASACWAIRPFRPSASLWRQGLGWVFCGLAFGAALLATGPTALPAIMLPIFFILLLVPRRLASILGLLAALAIGTLVVVPWVAHVHDYDTEIYRGWLEQLNPLGPAGWSMVASRAGERAVVILILLLPWTLWLFAAIAQPFSTSSRGVRIQSFIAWLWFVATTLVVLVLPCSGSSQKEITTTSFIFDFKPISQGSAHCLMVVPAVALLIGHLFSQWANLAAEGRDPRLWRVLRWPHVIFFVCTSIGIPWLLHGQALLVEWGVLSKPLTYTPGLLYWGGLAIVLVIVAGWAWRLTARKYPGRAMIAWVVWTIVLVTATMIPLVRSPSQQNPRRRVADRIAQIGVVEPMVWLSVIGQPPEPDPALLLYVASSLRPNTLTQLELLAAEGQGLSVLAPKVVTPPQNANVSVIPFEDVDVSLWLIAPFGLSPGS